MPIDIKKFSNIKEKITKSDRELLRFLKEGQTYTTNDVQKYLDINHTATLGRLKRLKKDGYLEVSMNRRVYYWKKIGDMPEEQITEGWGL